MKLSHTQVWYHCHCNIAAIYGIAIWAQATNTLTAYPCCRCYEVGLACSTVMSQNATFWDFHTTKESLLGAWSQSFGKSQVYCMVLQSFGFVFILCPGGYKIIMKRNLAKQSNRSLHTGVPSYPQVLNMQIYIAIVLHPPLHLFIYILLL